MDNVVTVIGNLTKEPELRYTTSGRAVVSFGLAVGRKWKDKNDEWQENTSFLNCVAWAELGENAAASLEKGNRVMVTGRMEQRSYETREGEKRSVVEIVCDDIAPSLKWATTTVERIDRGNPNGGSASAPPANKKVPDEEPF